MSFKFQDTGNADLPCLSPTETGDLLCELSNIKVRCSGIVQETRRMWLERSEYHKRVQENMDILEDGES
jgi:hypothetical protein